MLGSYAFNNKNHVQWKGAANVRTYSVPRWSSNYVASTQTDDLPRKVWPLVKGVASVSASHLAPVHALQGARAVTSNLHGTSNNNSTLGIEALDRPGRTSLQPDPAQATITVYLPQDTTNKYFTGQGTEEFTSIAANARRRCRSAGMYRPKFDPRKSNQPTYFSDTRMYLDGRSKSYHQNHYTHIRRGEPSLLNSGDHEDTFYAAHSVAQCPKLYIPRREDNSDNSNYLQYAWVDNRTMEPEQVGLYDLAFQEGYYNVEDFNHALHAQLVHNGHYLVEIATGLLVQFINIVYNHVEERLELQLYPCSAARFPSTHYRIGEKTDPTIADWSLPETAILPSLLIPSPLLATQLGYPAKTFLPALEETHQTEPRAILSGTSFQLAPMYNRLQYKPSNRPFKTDGGVSSSAQILRKKFDAMNTVAATYTGLAGGNQVAAAMAYGVTEQAPYTIKSKLAMPWTRTPFFWHKGQQKNKRRTMFNG